MRDGAFEIKRLGPRECSVARCYADSAELSVPDQIGGLRPVSLGPSFLPKRNKVRSVSLPPSVEEIAPETLSLWKHVERVECRGKALRSKDGVLYDDSLKVLLFYPPGREDDEYIAPGTLRRIASTAFLAGARLRSLVLPYTVESLDFQASDVPSIAEVYVEPGGKLRVEDGAVYKGKSLVFYPAGRQASCLRICQGCERLDAVFPESLKSLSVPSSLRAGLEKASRALEELSVDSGNLFYYAEDGVLFSRDLRLLSYPGGKRGRLCIIPGWVRKIEAFAFKNSKAETIVLSEGVQDIGSEAFLNSSLRTLVLPESVRNIDPRALSGASGIEEVWLCQGSLADVYIAAALPEAMVRYIAKAPC